MPDISIDAADGSGSFSAYCAMPESGGGPGIVVLQEIFGVNQVMRDLCDGFAANGYSKSPLAALGRISRSHRRHVARPRCFDSLVVGPAAISRIPSAVFPLSFFHSGWWASLCRTFLFVTSSQDRPSV